MIIIAIVVIALSVLSYLGYRNYIYEPKKIEAVGELSQAQLKYCANDVVYLHRIHEELNKILVRENRLDLYKKCLKFLSTRVDLDLASFKDDIWAH